MITDLYVPVPDFSGNDIAEITVVVKGKQLKYEFRIESFPWESFDNSSEQLSKSLTRIYNLKKAIESYDTEWELVQIFNPGSKDTHIRVLYKKKIKQTEKN